MPKYHGYGIRVSGDGRGDGEYPGGRTLREARKEAAKFVEYRTQGHMRSSADVKILGYDRNGRAYIVDVYEGRIDRPNRSGGADHGYSFIIQNGKERKVRNLAPLRRLIGKRVVELVSVGTYPDGSARMDTFFSNGDQASNKWADKTVLANSLRNWRGLYGVPLEWNGGHAGTIEYSNFFLTKESGAR